MGAHFAALALDMPAVRTNSALFNKRETAPVLTHDEMFPALGAPALGTAATAPTQVAPTVPKPTKMSFADLARKRAKQDEEEQKLHEEAEDARQLELLRRESEMTRIRRIQSVRKAYSAQTAVEPEEEFYDEGEADIRPEDMEDQEDQEDEEFGV
jgi:hypothetical protein